MNLEKAPQSGWKIGRNSFSKMICWFRDGNIRTMFSIDWKHKFSKSRDRNIGLNRFDKKIKEYGTKAQTIEVYDKESGKRIGKFIQGKKIE